MGDIFYMDQRLGLQIHRSLMFLLFGQSQKKIKKFVGSYWKKYTNACKLINRFIDNFD